MGNWELGQYMSLSHVCVQAPAKNHDPPPAHHRRMTADQRDYVRNLPIGARLPRNLERIARRAMNIAPLIVAAQHEHFTDVTGTLHLPRADDDEMRAGDEGNGQVYLAYQVNEDSAEPPELVTDSESDDAMPCNDPNLNENEDDPNHEAGAPLPNGVEQMLDSPGIVYYHIETSDSEGAASI